MEAFEFPEPESPSQQVRRRFARKERWAEDLAVEEEIILPVEVERTGQTGSILLTLVECCRRRGINPFEYLRDVLERLPGMTNHQVGELKPGLGRGGNPRWPGQPARRDIINVIPGEYDVYHTAG